MIFVEELVFLLLVVVGLIFLGRWLYNKWFKFNLRMEHDENDYYRNHW